MFLKVKDSFYSSIYVYFDKPKDVCTEKHEESTSLPTKTKFHVIEALHAELTFHNQEFVNTEKIF